MRSQSIRIDDIEIGERHRALSNDAVARLAASIKDAGLIQPITVRVVDEMMLDGQLTAGVPFLVAGHHRLAAAKLLGWSHIDCIEIDDDALKAELVEIAENLHRLDLTVEQRNEHVCRYAEIVEARIVGEKDQQIDRGRGRPESVAKKVAKELGLSRAKVRAALTPKPDPIPLPMHPHDPIDAFHKWSNDMNRVWGRAPADWRERWLEQIDAPVFDSTRAAA